MPWFAGYLDENAVEPFDRIDISRFLQAGEDLIDYCADECAQKKIPPIPRLLRRYKSEIRCGLIEVFFHRLGAPLSLEQKKDLFQKTGALFLSSTHYWDLDIDAMEPETKYYYAMYYWDQFKKLLQKDGNWNFEIDKNQIRREISCKLLLYT